jgi:putative tryptophan/tyrosine transport system substrate-binding protein
MSYVEGENLAIEYRWARGDYERLPALAADLVNKSVRVVATVGGEPPAMAAKGATSTIPIVFSMGSDPVQAGLVESYNRPGGNITGIDIVTDTIDAKRIGLVHDLVPQATAIGYLVNPAFSAARAQQRAVEEVGRALKLQVMILSASSDGEIADAFETMVQQYAAALAIGGAPFFDTRRAKLLALQSEHRLPTAYQFREYAAEGGVMSYGPNGADAYRASRALCRPDSQRRKTGGPASGAADQVRAGYQPEHRQGSRHHRAIIAACPSRRSHRMTIGGRSPPCRQRSIVRRG